MARFNPVPTDKKDRNGNPVYRNITKEEKQAIIERGAEASREIYGGGSGGSSNNTNSSGSQDTPIYQREGSNGLYVNIDDYNKNPSQFNIEPNAYRQTQQPKSNIQRLEGITTTNKIVQGKSGNILSQTQQATPTAREKASQLISNIRDRASPTIQRINEKTYGIVDFTSPQGALLTVVPQGKGLKILQKGGKIAKVGFETIKNSKVVNKAGRFAKDTAIGVTASLGIAKGTEIGINTFQGTNPTRQEKEIRGIAEREAEKVAKENGFISSLGYNLNPFTTSKNSKDAFKESVNKQLEQAGYSGEELNNMQARIETQRLSAGIGEPVGFLSIGKFGEKFGRKYTNEAFEELAERITIIPRKEAGLKVSKTVALPLVQAGFIEGTGAYAIQQTSRQQDLEFKEALIYGGAGSISAGTLGTLRAGLSVNNKGAGNVLGFALNVVDPFEKPSDLLQDLEESALRKLGRDIKTPVIFTNAPKELAGLGITGGKKGSSTPSINQQLASFSQLQVTIPSQQGSKNKPDSNIFGRGKNKPNPIPNPSNIITSSKQPINTPINNFTFLNEQTLNTNTPVANFNTIIDIPTATPLFRLPPPLPFSLPNFSSGRVGKGKGSKYLNELSISGSLLKSTLTDLRPPKVKVTRVSKPSIRGSKPSIRQSKKSFKAFLGL